MSDDKGRKVLPAMFGTLMEFILDYSGGTPDGVDPEEWLEGCSIPATDLRDRLRDLAMDYGVDWRDMELCKAQARWLGLDGGSDE